MKGLPVIFLLPVLGLLNGCLVTSNGPSSAEHPVYWQYFPNAQSVVVESPETVLALPNEAESFIDALRSEGHGADLQALDRFVEAVFNHRTQTMSYHSDANYTVSETFNLREANCLSLTLMTYVLATRLGYEATLNVVDIPEYWSRKAGYSVLNGHINITLSQRVDNQLIASRVVDFDQRIRSQQFSSHAVPLIRVLAMYYNNRAAVGLIEGKFDWAFANMAMALSLDPKLREAWTNLGVLYRINEHYDAAEQAYIRAIDVDHDDLTAKENLAILYRLTGRTFKALSLESQVAAERESNPYYHLILGDEDYEEGLFDQAHTHYRQAYRLDRRNHLILAAMGRSAFSQGELANARLYLERARRIASQHRDIARYSAKLAVLSSTQRVN